MEYILFSIAFAALLMAFIGGFSLLWVNRKTQKTLKSFPFVSILKPLKGLDDQLDINLESFYCLDYPQYEIIFCSERIDDPSLALVHRLVETYPHIPTQIVIGADPIGLNPKVRVLSRATKYARGELLLVSDSNVKVSPHYLRETLVSFEDKEIALTSNLIVGVGEQSIGATLENLQLNGFIAPAICFGLTLKQPPCVVGKSMVFRRADLESIGGWASLGNVLAEDYIMGQKLLAQNRKISINTHVVETVNISWSTLRFLERHSRWLKMRWSISPFALCLEIFSNVTLWSILGLVCAGLTPQALAAALLLIGGRGLVDAMCAHSLRPNKKFPIALLLLVPLRDIAIAILWAHARISRTVQWRSGQKLMIGHNTTLSLPGDQGLPQTKAIDISELQDSSHPAPYLSVASKINRHF